MSNNATDANSRRRHDDSRALQAVTSELSRVEDAAAPMGIAARPAPITGKIATELG